MRKTSFRQAEAASSRRRPDGGVANTPQLWRSRFGAAGTPITIPAPNMGTVCVVGAGRARVGQASGPNRSVSFPIDLTAVPTGSGTVAVQPGTTLYFFAIHRDAVAGQAIFALSNAIQIDF